MLRRMTLLTLVTWLLAGALMSPNAAAAAPAEPVTVPSHWPISLNKQQAGQLYKLGCRFDPKDRLVARILAKRGFDARRLVGAYRDLRKLGLRDRKWIPSLAAYRILRLPWHKVSDFINSGVSLTEYYNRRIVGGKRMYRAGLALTIIGLSTLAVSGIIAAIDLGVGGWWASYISSITALPIGAGLTVIGVPLWVVGKRRYRHWIGEEYLDRAPLHELHRFRLHSRLIQQQPAPMRLSLAPLAYRGGGGVSFGLRF